MAGIYKRGKVWYVKYSRDGRIARRSLGTKNKADALKIKEAIEETLLTEKLGLAESKQKQVDSSIETFWEEYSEYARMHKRRRTIENEELFWRQFVGYVKPKKLGDVTRKGIERFKAKRIEDGLKPQSVNNALRSLQAIYNYAKKLGYYSGDNPFVGVARFKLEKNPPKFLNKEQIEKILTAAKEHSRDIHLVFALGIYTGLRKQEIVNARWEWLDFDHKTITLSSHEGFQLKNSETRTIPLHDGLAELLAPHREEEGFIFLPNKDGQAKHRYRYEFRRAFDAVLKRTELECTPHILRHTFASQLAIAGVSLYKISKWLGHSDTKVTQIYAHLQTHDEDINRF